MAFQNERLSGGSEFGLSRTPGDPGTGRAGGAAEAGAAGVGIVLAIIGLAGAAARVVDPIAVIAMGAAFLFERWAFSSRAAGEAWSGGRDRAAVLAPVVGWAGLALGILALLGLAPRVLIPIALILFGGGLVVSAARHTGRSILGFIAAALGVLALIQINPRVLTLIGMLVVGLSLLVAGLSVATRFHLPTVRRHAA